MTNKKLISETLARHEAIQKKNIDNLKQIIATI